MSAESLSQGNEALRKAAQHVVNESPHAAKVQEVTTGLWSRLPEAARKAAPPAAGALTVRALSLARQTHAANARRTLHSRRAAPPPMLTYRARCAHGTPGDGAHRGGARRWRQPRAAEGALPHAPPHALGLARAMSSLPRSAQHIARAAPAAHARWRRASSRAAFARGEAARANASLMLRLPCGLRAGIAAGGAPG
jgi:hypothetical protein